MSRTYYINIYVLCLILIITSLAIGIAFYSSGCGNTNISCPSYKRLNVKVLNYIINDKKCKKCISHYKSKCVDYESYKCYDGYIKTEYKKDYTCNIKIEYNNIEYNSTHNKLLLYPINNTYIAIQGKNKKICYFIDNILLINYYIGVIGLVICILTIAFLFYYYNKLNCLQQNYCRKKNIINNIENENIENENIENEDIILNNSLNNIIYKKPYILLKFI